MPALINRRAASKNAPFGAAGKVGRATFTVGAETGGNTINVAIQLHNPNGIDCAQRVGIPFYLSDDANGDSVVATAPSGGIAIGTDGLMFEWTDNKAGMLVSEADGDIDITIIEAGAKTLYIVLVMPDGSLVVSDAVTFAA